MGRCGRPCSLGRGWQGHVSGDRVGVRIDTKYGDACTEGGAYITEYIVVLWEKMTPKIFTWNTSLVAEVMTLPLHCVSHSSVFENKTALATVIHETQDVLKATDLQHSSLSLRVNE